jgi:hypothetical protein
MITGGKPFTALAGPSCRMLTVSSRTKTDTSRRTHIGMLTLDDASPLRRTQKERRGPTASKRKGGTKADATTVMVLRLTRYALV